VECHDSHSSERRMLLLDTSDRPDRTTLILPARMVRTAAGQQ